MLQTGALMRDVTPRELLAMMASLYPDPLEVTEALELVGLTEIADRRTQKLSGGQAQRVRFALAPASDPAVLILDEPTVGMDVEARRRCWVSVRGFAPRGKTVIFAPHYKEEADVYADRVMLIADGRVVADGATSEIRGPRGPAHDPRNAAGRRSRRPGLAAGVSAAERRGESIVLICVDSDAAVQALLAAYPHARDIEVAGAGLEDAFVEPGDPNHTIAAVERQEALA
jgi:ABC-2 type transport system ATP-binding protein